MATVTLNQVYKTYADVVAVDRVSLVVEDGDFVALVGPSGCGKTTTLNLIAGLIELTDGDIYIGEKLINDLDPKDRDLAMVFQNYALYPNKSVADNLAFPLKMRGIGKSEIKERVQRTAEILSIGPLLDRRPKQLSGGQQQRVALGRALVRNPEAFLMDEPLSNLDAKLRVQMRAELKRFHQEIGATVVYVTHDQLEAVTMADKMAVMNGGLLQQYGPPVEVFENPANTFVAGFVGSPAMNLLRGSVVSTDGVTAVRGEAGWEHPLSDANARRAATSTGDVILGIRHGNMRLYSEVQAGTIPAKIYTVEPTGDFTFVHLRLGEHILVASADASYRAAPDQPVWVEFDQDHLHIFDAETEQAIPRDSSRANGSAAAVDPRLVASGTPVS